MSNPDRDRYRPLPDWLEAELKAAPPPSEELLEHDQHLFGGFQAMVRAEAAARSRPAPVDALFSMAGRLLEVAGEAVRRLAPRPAHLAAAGTEAALAPAPARPIDRVARQAGDALIVASTYRSGAGAEIELAVVRAEDAMELRPFTATAYDAEGAIVAGPVEVREGDPLPRLPRLSEGCYTFAVTWPGGRGVLRVEFITASGR